MADDAKHDSWSAGQSYEHYMGRWSRLAGVEFLRWLQPPQGLDWVDIGCGTGALTQSILDIANPASVVGIDPSDGFVAHAREAIADRRARFEVSGAEALPLGDGTVDAAVSALALNFVPDMPRALREMRRVLRPEGLLSFFVWDYPGGGIGFIDRFWKAAAEIDPGARDLDEAGRFPFCTPDGLAEICRQAGLDDVTVHPVEVTTTFADFEAFWHPFTLGAGPAPGYCMALPEENRAALKSLLERQLGADGGAISLLARAWAVQAPHLG